MNFEFKLPDIGEGTVEGEIVKWLVKPGDVLTEDQPMVEVMTDKATVVLPSPRAGTVVETRGKEGDIAKVGAVIVVIATDGAGAKPAAPAAATKPATAASVPASMPAPTASSPQAPSAKPQAPAGDARSVLATPATRKLAREKGMDITQVPGSGRQGQVTRDDVEKAAGGSCVAGQFHNAMPTSLEQAAMAVAGPGALGPSAALAASMSRVPARAIPAPAVSGEKREERTPFRGLRKKIAEKMHQSKTTAAHFTYVEDCDFTELGKVRASLKPRAEEYGVKLTYLPFFFKAMALTLRRHPKLNSMLDEKTQEWVVKHYYNIGISVDTPTGLIVPVVKHCESRSILSIAAELQRVADEARAGKSKLDDIQGGTITVTSVGNIGGVLATPIINFPEVAIVGLNKIAPRPVVRDGQIVIRDMAYLAISLDHRLVDGADGARFMTDLVKLLENPAGMMLEMV